MNKNFKIQRSAQGGFTLIELIVVIVILGILAATALPKFANLSGDARTASVQAAKGALASASAMVHGKYLVNPTSYASLVPVEGANVNMTNGYAAADSSFAAAAGLSSNDYTITAGGGTGGSAATLTISPISVATANVANCSVVYTAALANGVPNIAVNTGNCN